MVIYDIKISYIIILFLAGNSEKGMGTMTIQEMQERKKETGITYAEIARRAGLPLPTVQKILSGATKSPRYDTILALEKVLSPSPGLRGEGPGFPDPSSAPGAAASTEYSTSVQATSPYRDFLASEPQPAYSASPAFAGAGGASENAKGGSGKRVRRTYPLLPQKQQGEYTAADREALPGDIRTELIDGVIYDMASPKAAHQIVLMNLSNQLFNQIEKCGRDCTVFVAPSDVWLTQDDKNIFQPDIYVICDYAMIGTDGYTKGAPPFIIEILSPSTRSKDILLKSYKYHDAGVREYWIVDPENRQVAVYDYDRDPDGTVYTKYGFDGSVPVSLSGGACTVDFRKIAAALDRIGM